MMFSPAHALPHDSALPPRRGRNLGQPRANSRLAHFLFEPFKQFVADGSNANESAVCSPPAASTGAAMNRRKQGPTFAAKSRPSPFPQINHVAHGFSSVRKTGDSA